MGHQGQAGGTSRGHYHKKKSPIQDMNDTEYKFKPHKHGKNKQNISYGKMVEKITTETQTTYERRPDVA